VPVHVRVRDSQALRERLETVSSHAQVAMRAGMSPARLSQILTGRAPRIRVAQAARLEEVLDVPRGTFFTYAEDDAELAVDYLLADAPGLTEPGTDEPDCDVPAGDGEA
jgi:transcriptional regulator with XRE-family HTH domain